MPEHRDAGVALLFKRGIVTHKRIEGTQAPTGPIIALTGRPDYEYDTACGIRIRATEATVKRINVTCQDCLAAWPEET